MLQKTSTEYTDRLYRPKEVIHFRPVDDAPEGCICYIVTRRMPEYPLVTRASNNGPWMLRSEAAAFLETLCLNAEWIEDWSLLADAAVRLAGNSHCETYVTDMIQGLEQPEPDLSEAVHVLTLISEAGDHGSWPGPVEEIEWIEGDSDDDFQVTVKVPEDHRSTEEEQADAREECVRFGAAIARLTPNEHIDAVRTRLTELIHWQHRK